MIADQNRKGNHVNLLFCINQGYVTTFINCLRTIEINGGAEHYDVYILHSDLTEESMDRIRKSAVCSDFHFYQVKEEIFDGFPEFKRYPRQIYYRIIAPLLLPKDLDRILYLDADLVVINPLDELYNESFDNKWFIACTHSIQLLDLINQIRLGAIDMMNIPYINTGVILMNLEALRKEIDIDEIRQYVKTHKLTFILPDQDIIFGMYGDKIKLADTLIYNLSDRILFFHNSDPLVEPIDVDWVRKNSVIIHYCGKNKPWKKDYIGSLNVFYDEMVPYFNKSPDEIEIHPETFKAKRMEKILNTQLS